MSADDGILIAETQYVHSDPCQGQNAPAPPRITR